MIQKAIEAAGLKGVRVAGIPWPSTFDENGPAAFFSAEPSSRLVFRRRPKDAVDSFAITAGRSGRTGSHSGILFFHLLTRRAFGMARTRIGVLLVPRRTF